MPISIDTLFLKKLKASHTAHLLSSSTRMKIALQSIGGNTSISHLASCHDVSRKYIYTQRDLALKGIAQAFKAKGASSSDEKVLFYIPVTKAWLVQVLLALIFICRASYGGVIEFFRDILDYKICKGTVHNIVYEHLEKAKQVNQEKDLSEVREGLHDEIYQAGKPVLTGCCARSTYCYLLKSEETCDANSWGVNLLDLQEQQKLAPDFTVLDGGLAARAGQRDAWPEIPAHGDIFHALKPFLELVTYLENRANDNLRVVEDLKNKINGRKGKWKDEDNRLSLYKKLLIAEKAWEKAAYLAGDIETLYKWMKNDILSLVGPLSTTRKELLKFIVEQLSEREALCSHKIKPVCTYLENHIDNLLAFMPIMEMRFHEIAQEYELPLAVVWEIYQLKGLPLSSQKRWEKHVALQSQLGHKHYWIESRIEEVLKKATRANSLVENLNSRLRTYFTLRRELGNEYLAFLQFFLNHRRFMRSEYAERVGKSPAELLTGQAHQHWLELLGFKLFKQAA